MCNKNLDGWESGDEAWAEHVKHQPTCPLVRLDMESSRLATFGADLWPHHATIPMPKMARAGFFYWPKLLPTKSQVDDTAVCFQCGLALDGWEPGDDPHHEHTKRRPECPFVKNAVAIRPCSFEFLLASKPDLNAVRHISARPQARPSDKKFQLPGAVPTKRIPVSDKDVGRASLAALNPIPPSKRQSIQIVTRDEKDTSDKDASPKRQSASRNARDGSIVPSKRQSEIKAKANEPEPQQSLAVRRSMRGSSIVPAASASTTELDIGRRASRMRRTTAVASSAPSKAVSENEPQNTNVPPKTAQKPPRSSARQSVASQAKAAEDKQTLLVGLEHMLDASHLDVSVEKILCLLRDRKVSDFDARVKEALDRFGTEAAKLT